MEKLDNFGFYKVYTHSKDIVETVLRDYFSMTNKEFNFLAPTIKFFEYNVDETQSKIGIFRDWYQKIQQLPFLVVSLQNMRERPLTFEQPSLLGDANEIIVGTSTGFLRIGSAVEMNAIITIGAEDGGSRGNLIDLLFFLFTIYRKQPRIYTETGRERFVFTTTKKEVELTGENEVKIGQGSVEYIYTASISVPIFIEFQYQIQIPDIQKFFSISGSVN